MSLSVKAIIGLGNPGPRYAYTRHNIGFLVVEALAKKYNSTWHIQHNFEKSTITIYNQNILLIKPQTYMNKSGEIIPYLKKQGIHAENILVVHDELEKPFGKLAIKKGGSARGHNGLRSLIQFLGPDFYRLPVGISRPQEKEYVAQYVLDNFSEPPQEVENCIISAVGLIEDFVQNSRN